MSFPSSEGIDPVILLFLRLLQILLTNTNKNRKKNCQSNTYNNTHTKKITNNTSNLTKFPYSVGIVPLIWWL